MFSKQRKWSFSGKEKLELEENPDRPSGFTFCYWNCIELGQSWVSTNLFTKLIETCSICFPLLLLWTTNSFPFLQNMFLGGIDTSALTVNWAMAELVKNPTLMKKAQDEVRSTVGKKGRVTETDLDQLQYLKMAIKETLRLHPPAPMLIPRQTMDHFRINGYDIEPETLVQINVWAIGRDPRYWKKAEEFFPERFIDNTVDFKGQDFEFLPFGSGRRGCPGVYMGTVTSELLLANLLYCFDWELPGGMKESDFNMEELGGHCLTLTKKTPLLLVPKKYIPSWLGIVSYKIKLHRLIIILCFLYV